MYNILLTSRKYILGKTDFIEELEKEIFIEFYRN
jgi:hypothetical protein